MQRSSLFVLTAALSTLVLAGSARAGCGLNVNPVALDRNHDAQLSRNEIRGTALEAVLDRIDTNHDGVISQHEFINRCASLRATRDNGWGSDWQDSAAGKQVTEKARREQQRQSERINQRVNQETDRATDSVVDKAMGAIFGH